MTFSPTYNHHLDDYNDDNDSGHIGIDKCDHDDDNNDYDDYGNLHRKLGETLCLLIFWISSTTAKGAMEIPTLYELYYNIVVWTTSWAPSQATGSTAASSVAYSSTAVS